MAKSHTYFSICLFIFKTLKQHFFPVINFSKVLDTKLFMFYCLMSATVFSWVKKWCLYFIIRSTVLVTFIIIMVKNLTRKNYMEKTSIFDPQCERIYSI